MPPFCQLFGEVGFLLVELGDGALGLLVRLEDIGKIFEVGILGIFANAVLVPFREVQVLINEGGENNRFAAAPGWNFITFR
jgi:hypothetical protein